MTGVARVADLAAFWALMGLVVALSEIVSRPAPSPERDPPAHVPRRRGRRGRRLAGASPSAGLVPLVLAALVGLAALAVFIQRDVRMLRAGWLAAQGYERTETGEGNRALDLFERAADLAPDVERYHLEVSRLLTIGGQQAPDADAARAAYRAAYDAAARYERRDPYAYATQRRLATAAVDLAGAGEPGQLPEIADRYLKLAALLPSYPKVQSLAANGLVAAREFELGVLLADRAIAMETESKPVPRAWWARGEALVRLGDADEAERSFETAIERAPESQYAADSHRGLAKLLDERGEPDAAAEHRALAAEIEAALAAEPS
jgi:tetratricopeptide (TPR) repeat protein